MDLTDLMIGDISVPTERSMRAMLAALLRAGADSAFIRRYHSPPKPLLPPDAHGYLVESNPRLIQLRDQYAALAIDCVQHSQWNPQYVSGDIPLQAFRGDCAFVWQLRDLNLPVSYVLTYQYLLASGQSDLLRLLTEDELFGIYAIPSSSGWITRDRLDSTTELWFLERHLTLSARTTFHVLDIGAGYGRFAYRALQAYDAVNVSCLDAIARSTFLCEYYLSFRDQQQRSRAVPLVDVESDSHVKDADMAVNIHSFSECPVAAIRWWLKFLKCRKIQYLMVVPNPDQHKGQRLLSMEPNRSRCDFLRDIEDAGYRRVVVEPKYQDPAVQNFGITPSYYFLFELRHAY
jgi:hypothetical protein